MKWRKLQDSIGDKSQNMKLNAKRYRKSDSASDEIHNVKRLILAGVLLHKLNGLMHV